MPEELLTIKEIARRLDLPESNVRYYRDKFEEYLPHVGQGRKRRYLPQAIEVFALIAESLKSNVPSEEIALELSRRFPRTPQIRNGQTGLAHPWPDANPEPVSALLRSQAQALEDLSGLLKNQSEQKPRDEVLRKNQQYLKKGLVLLWRKQQRIEALLSRESGTTDDHGLGEILVRLEALEGTVEKGPLHEPDDAQLLRSTMSRFDEEISRLADHTQRLEERLHTLSAEKADRPLEVPAPETQDLVVERIVGLEDRLNNISREMAREGERVEQSLLEIRRELACLSRLDEFETRLAELAPQSELETLEQGLLRLSSILERFAGRIETVEKSLSDLSPHNLLAAHEENLGQLKAMVARLDNRLDAQSDDMEKLRSEAGAVPLSADQMNELSQGLHALSARLAAVEAVISEPRNEQPAQQKGDMAYLSATIGRLNHSLETVSSRIGGIEQKLGSEVERLNTYVHTCWSGIQKLSRALKENG
jgi:DNA-binding transcriptional MerR regulator